MNDLFEAAGTLAAASRRVDWARTPLGPVPSWSPTMRTVLDVALHTRFPVTLLWGPRFSLVYNEAYVPLIGAKHPAALGAPAAEVFPEIWDVIGPMLDEVRATGRANLAQDLRLLMDRRGFPEECFFTFSYSAVRGPGGQVEGIVDIAAETTPQMLSQRRLALLATLTDRLAGLEHHEEVVERALEVLRSDPLDLPDVDVRAAGADDGRTVLFAISPRQVLSARLSPYVLVDDAFRRFLRLIGAAIAQAADRVQAREAELRVVALERQMSESLQRSLLTEPVRPDGLQVAVRYQPAAQQAHIGGDWHDAFLLPSGLLALAVGDVSGHDHRAAAAMAQLRNLLRGVAYTTDGTPARVLGTLEAAMRGLAVGTYASAVLARVEHDVTGARLLRWSNAGHPYPLLLRPDGSVTLLHTPSDPLLGIGEGAARHDHMIELEPGASVILYTDGLVDRRDVSIDEGFAELAGAVAGRAGLTAEELCDHLLAHFAEERGDDIVILVVQAPA